MTRTHAALIAAAVALAVVAGAFAAIRTTQLGASSNQHVSPVVLATQAKALDRTEVALQRALRSQPSTLPAAPQAEHEGEHEHDEDEPDD